ncbi:hypothetical protein K2173_024001 [Erythroxylum novogranatense]|uniref:SHSP domain-containing protein n=1 Tax=Erythroxylum novogranatense TaxID=1862640 RepID=A0AAV8TRC6_9ROSI|nr:hypothetical protein K2173_024001 [Erythroxylum novogranatense]
MALWRFRPMSRFLSNLYHRCPPSFCTLSASDDAPPATGSSDSEDIVALTKKAKQSIADVKRLVKDIQSPEIIDSICEEFYWHPFQEGGNERPYEVKEDDNKWYARVDMPGIGIEGVRVWLNNNTLYFKGEEEGKKKEKDDPYHVSRVYSSNFSIPPGQYQTDKIRAFLNNGVLKIVIPKVKLDDKCSSVNVQVAE